MRMARPPVDRPYTTPESGRERDDYYEILERTQKGTLDVTNWFPWFLECLDRTIVDSERSLAGVFKRMAGRGYPA